MKLKRLLLALLAALIIHPALALANVAYVSNGGESEASGTSVTANVPSGVVNGDLLIAEVFAKSQSAAMPAQTGWTNALDYQASYPAHLAIYYRYASSEPASYTFTAAASSVYTSAVILRITGAVTSGNPFDAIGSGSDVPGTAATAVAASITTVTANTLAIQFIGLTDGSLTVSSYPSGYTGVDGGALVFAYKSFVGPGATGTATTTFSANAAGGTVLAAVKSAAGGSCTHAGQAKDGSTSVPNGTTGSYWGKAGNWVTPDCSSIYYWSPAAGNFVVN